MGNQIFLILLGCSITALLGAIGYLIRDHKSWKTDVNYRLRKQETGLAVVNTKLDVLLDRSGRDKKV